ncbi:phosphopantetheine-binding protein [Streptomyces sp. G3]|uniref:Acyl carrier protein n=2 Tax=Streptomyces TaxID=1883 RepID=A0ABW8BP10_9ACTN|nr:MULTISPECIES: phosphopantetheine-binding protein [Streptomyces]WSU00767.1 phosphopantetheine-binding protein [Streptomyces sp. NBC_01124]AZM75035.1 acyl carrier protein [Streptomyces sp. KPB2]MBH5132881.1 acyl carrier protein [Streptomyces sp. HB-N217]MCM1936595.1 phosphopantetheine-binding protein [Streptomyces sp. G3]MCQ4199810.1 phosphopantetheine-binding protein [Streptomyces coelicoflavus]
MSTTYDRLVDLLVDGFAVDRAAIRPDVTFEELEMDSLFLVELLLVIQSEFGVKISEDAAVPTDTISHAVALVDSEIAATAS